MSRVRYRTGRLRNLLHRWRLCSYCQTSLGSKRTYPVWCSLRWSCCSLENTQEQYKATTSTPFGSRNRQVLCTTHTASYNRERTQEWCSCCQTTWSSRCRYRCPLRDNSKRNQMCHNRRSQRKSHRVRAASVGCRAAGRADGLIAVHTLVASIAVTPTRFPTCALLACRGADWHIAQRPGPAALAVTTARHRAVSVETAKCTHRLVAVGS